MVPKRMGLGTAMSNVFKTFDMASDLHAPFGRPRFQCSASAPNLNLSPQSHELGYLGQQCCRRQALAAWRSVRWRRRPADVDAGGKRVGVRLGFITTKGIERTSIPSESLKYDALISVQVGPYVDNPWAEGC